MVGFILKAGVSCLFKKKLTLSIVAQINKLRFSQMSSPLMDQFNKLDTGI